MSRAVYNGDLPAGDKTYLAQIVAGRTGYEPAGRREARRRRVRPGAESKAAGQRTRPRRLRTPLAKRASASPFGLSSRSWSAPFRQATWRRLADGSATKRRYLNRRRSGAVFRRHPSKVSRIKGVLADALSDEVAGLPRSALHTLDVPVDHGKVFVFHALPLGDALLAILVHDRPGEDVIAAVFPAGDDFVGGGLHVVG